MPSKRNDRPQRHKLFWDTSEVHSTTASDGSALVPDYHGRALRRALDKKVRQLKTSELANADLSLELDHVVCRLMKLALRTSKARQTPPPTRWMQCKLLDLLTLTEKAIARRKRHFIENFSVKAFEIDRTYNKMALRNLEDDATAIQIVNKYQKLLEMSESIEFSKKQLQSDYCTISSEQDFYENFTHGKIKDYDINEIDYASAKLIPPAGVEYIVQNAEPTLDSDRSNSKLKMLVRENFDNKAITSQSELSIAFDNKLNSKNSDLITKENKVDIKPETKISNESIRHKTKCEYSNNNSGNEQHLSKTKLPKHVISKNSYLRNVRRKSLIDDYEKGAKSKRQIREPKKLQPTASKPIPGSIIELCKPEMMNQKNLDNYNNYNSTCCKVESDNNISATEENLLMDIVMDDTEETIALRRTIGTDPDMDSIALEQETVVKITRDESSVNNLQFNIENEQAIFLYDINEPSTSKGVRHVSMDVQCGPDIATPAGAMVSPANSLMRMPKMFSTGIKIGDSMTNLAVHNNSLNFGTCTDYKERFGTPRMKSSKAFSRGIAFGESPHNLQGERPCSVSSINENEYFGSISPILKIPNVLSKTIAINDSLRDIEMKLSSDFGTSARDNRSSEFNNNDANSKQTVIIENNKEENKIFGPVSFRNEGALFSKGVNIKNSSNTVTLDSHSVTIEKASEQPKGKTLQIFNVNVEVGRKLQDKVKDKLVCNVSNNENEIRASGNNLFVTSNEDSLTNLKTENKHDLGSATDNTYNKISQDGKATGIKIKDSDLNITLKSDCGTSIEIVPDVQTPYTFLSERSSSIDTRLLKAISSGIKTEDSNSEIYGSCGSQRSIHYTVSSKPSRNKIKFSNIDRYTDKSRNHMHPYLSCSGIYIHSYKEKLICEDVVFQGEWLRNIPKVNYRKKPHSITSVRKLSDHNLKKKKKISKEKLQYNMKPDPSQVNVDLQKVVQVRTPKVIKVKETLKTAQNKNIAAARDCKLPKPIIKLVKVASRVKCNLSNCSVKSTRLSRIRSRPPLPPVVLNAEDIKVSKLPVPIKRYIPAYLRRKIAEQSSIVNTLNTMPDKLLTRAEEKEIDLSLLPSEQLKKEMIQFSDQARNNINYIVCRNEINNVSKSASDSQESDNTKQNPKKKNNGNKEKRCYSPVSQTSSTCSTPDSVATVKPVSTRPKTNRRHTNTTSPNKSSRGNSESESNTPVRNRKFTKRSKTGKKSDDKQNENKNNVPESSMKFTEREPIITSGFTGRQSVYMAQMTNDSTAPANSLSKNRPYVSNKPSIKIPTSEDSVEKKKSKSATNNVNSNSNVHFGSNESKHNTENKKQECPITSTPREHTPVTNRVLSDWFGTTNKNKAISAENGVLTAMRQLVEDRLVFLDKSVTKIVTDSDKNLKDHEIDSVKYNETSSPMSFKTVDGNDSGVNDIDMDALNRSLDMNFGESIMSLIDTNPSIPDLDFMSFQSVVSSKYSEYFMADNEDKRNTNYKHNVSSVKDIFERKEPPMTQNPGPLATQAFSGFSMNADPVAGDQPDYSNLIDSEAASLAINVARQTTSEELFVSGRSSESYESCLIDEDAVVPNWLFNIISQQQSVIEATNIREVGQSGESRSNWRRPTGEVPPPYRIPQPNNTILNSIVFLPVAEDRDNMMMDLPVPLGEPLLDVNGNALETNIGAGAGAGDGRGMHSDHSQDSSGHGTSLSSSDTSSGQQSQAILIDPSTFTGHYDLLHDAIPSSVGTTALVAPRPDSPDPSYRAININDGPTRSGAARTSARARRNAPFVSDGEADVSSLDTDATDIPSDN